MYTLLKPLQVREALLEKGIRIFTPYDFERIFHTSPLKTKYFIETQTEEGLFSRLKQGIYTLKTDYPSEEEIANALYKPSYISFEYALAYWNIIPEMPYTITSATTKPTRLFTTSNLSFGYYTIKKEAYTGYRLLKVNRSISVKTDNIDFSEIPSGNLGIKSFFIAEPEKALVDFLYFVSIGQRIVNDRVYYKSDSYSKEKLLKYAQLYERKKLMELVKNYL